MPDLELSPSYITKYSRASSNSLQISNNCANSSEGCVVGPPGGSFSRHSAPGILVLVVESFDSLLSQSFQSLLHLSKHSRIVLLVQESENVTNI